MNYPVVCFLIDDDPDDQEIFSIAVKQTEINIHCVFASDGVEALEKINADPSFIPDYIFIDLNMPRMNGVQCLKAIKKINKVKNIPAFIYSTSSDPKMMEETKALGAFSFILKPVSITALVDILIKCFKKL